MPSHTPAPWKGRKERSASGVPSLYIYTGTTIHDFNDIAEVYTNTSHDGDGNARLIAVAPELYDALQNLVTCAEVYDEFNDPNHDYYMAMHKAFMALYRVKGEAG